VEPRGLSSRLTMLLYPLTRRSPDHALVFASSWASRLGITPGCTGYLRVASCTLCCGPSGTGKGDTNVCTREQGPSA
jgi:hypothetical protein